MAKRNLFVCSNCGYESRGWLGQCPSCGEWNSFEEINEVASTSKGSKSGNFKAVDIEYIGQAIKTSENRFSTGYDELDRVLGTGSDGKSGLVSGSVVLVSGDPGIGKSTLLLKVCANLLKSGEVLYVSGEESVSQIASRGERILSKKEQQNLGVVHAFRLEEILETIEKANAKFVVIDSIQIIESIDARGFPGGISQVRTATAKIVNFAKANNVSVFIIGHINKEGNIAGPKILEHLVDVVIQMEGEKDTEYRILRSLKNRFGTTNEVGIFQMKGEGIEDVKNPSEIFLSGEMLPGVCRTPVLEGNRVIIAEVQALVNTTVFALPKRVAEGISLSRLQLLCAIIQKYLKVNLSSSDVYVNIGANYKIKDRAVDLAIVLAILSAVKGVSLASNSIAFGEVSLTGVINKVISAEKRIKESNRLKYTGQISSDNYKYIRELLRLFK